MIRTIDPGTSKPCVNAIPNVIYRRGVPSLEGGVMDLRMTILMPGQPPKSVMEDPNVEIEGAIAEELPKLPTILWIPGGGWRGQKAIQMVCELREFCEAGYVVACADYRTSAQAKYPAQLEDVKAAIRFLRAKGAPYWVDPERIAVMGRSAGGHLTSLASMNLDGCETEDWAGVSSKVQCGVDLFGPTDMAACCGLTRERIKQPGFRWKSMEESHEYALLGNLEPETIRAADPITMVNLGMADMLILHGTRDPLIPHTISEGFYRRIEEVCGPGKAELVLLEGAEHGTDEFWQSETKRVILDYLDTHLKNRKAGEV